MQSYGRGRVVPHTNQNHQVYDTRGYPQIQQDPMFMTYAPYLSNPLYLQQEPIGYMTYAPYPQYPQQEIGYTAYSPYPLYSQQEIGAHLLQGPTANDMVLQDQVDQNFFPQSHYRRERMPEFRNGEMVMVRFNQTKWLNGVIQRMSTQGMQIWIIDANVLVNVPLVLLPTHVLKMTTHSTLESLPQVEPMWTLTDHGEYQKVLVQCVRPAHPFYALDNNVCAICKLRISSIIDMVSPWNCCHQVHNSCFQLQVQQSSILVCPSCNENSSRQSNLLNRSSFAHHSPSNGQHQQFDFQCACGFKSAMIGNINAAIFCPNCQRFSNISSLMTNSQSDQALNSMNINPVILKVPNREPSTNMNPNSKFWKMQSGELLLNMDLLHSSPKPEREIPQSSESKENLQSSKFEESPQSSKSEESPQSSKSVDIIQDSEFVGMPERERFFSAQDFRFGWPMQSFSGYNRLAAIEEGPEVNTSSLEPTSIEERYEQPFYYPSYLQAQNKTLKNNNISYQKLIAMRPNDQDVQPSSSFQSSLHEDILYEPSSSRTEKIQNKEYSNARSSFQDGSSYGSLDVSYSTPTTSTTPTTPNQKEHPNFQITLQNDFFDANPCLSTTLIQREQSSSQSALEIDLKNTPVFAPFTLFNNESCKNKAFDTKQLATSLSKDKFVPLIKLIEVEEASKSIQQIEMDKMTTLTTKGYKTWKEESKPNITIPMIKDQRLGTKPSQTITSIVEIEGPKIWEKLSETNNAIETTKSHQSQKASRPNTIHFPSEDHKLKNKVNETFGSFDPHDGRKREKNESGSNTFITDIDTQNLWKRTSEPNITIATTKDESLEKNVGETIIGDILEEPKFWEISAESSKFYAIQEDQPNANIAIVEGQEFSKTVSESKLTDASAQDQGLKMQMSEIITTLATDEGQKLGKWSNEPSLIHSTQKNQDLLKISSELKFDDATNEGRMVWRRASEVDWTKNEENVTYKEMEKDGSSNYFVASPSSTTPTYINHLDGDTQGQRLWRRASTRNWSKKTVNNDEIMESKELDSSMVARSAPKFVNHFVDFVKLAMGDGSPVANDIIASASASTMKSSLILNSPPSLETVPPQIVSPPPAFFTRASSLFDEATSTSPIWITVIKDGIDSRKDDKQWE